MELRGRDVIYYHFNSLGTQHTVQNINSVLPRQYLELGIYLSEKYF